MKVIRCKLSGRVIVVTRCELSGRVIVVTLENQEMKRHESGDESEI